MRRTSQVRSPEIPSQSRPLIQRGSYGVIEKEVEGFTTRAASGSSNSTSSSSIVPGTDEDPFRSRPKIQQESENLGAGKSISLQAAFAARRGKGKRIESIGAKYEDTVTMIAEAPPDVLTKHPVERLKSPLTSSQSSPLKSDDIKLRAQPKRNTQPISESIPQILSQCSSCGRKFNEDVISRHEDICNRQKKRSPFDSRNHRLAGVVPTAAQTNATGSSKPKILEAPIPVKKASWRDKSDQLRAAIGAARATDPRERMRYEQDLARANQASLTRCEYCGRSFNSEAAQRHIPICRSKAAMIPRQIPGRISLAGTGASLRTPAAVKNSPVVVDKMIKLPPINSRGYSKRMDSSQSKSSVYRSASSFLGNR
jgi:rubrerythrin